MSIIPNKPNQSDLLEAVLNFTETNPTSFTYIESLSTYKYEDSNVKITFTITADSSVKLIVTDVNDAMNTLTFEGKISDALHVRLIKVAKILENSQPEVIATNLLNLIPV